MTMEHLLLIHDALVRADVQLTARVEELRRLQDVEMIPISISLSTGTDQKVRAAIEVVTAAIAEITKGATA